ncbi:RnfABCDGE type electron transport complex subunit D [Leucothrix arctica]|uniref:Ion-translocating oxidoreductase complex subunit D n=1 Tax=Leucothrix arctica TaxID=1481894 RepID=A0A317C5W3_9GAMM|nr:RnfABCDGE type electron transport complex subunit D [Leucothrix arctica]PWQ93649.1 electron transport complex subunit RsxD [Leucothrix arctica]
MQFDTRTAGLVNDAPDISHLMKQVLVGLSLGIVTLFMFYGWGVLINLVLAIVFAVSLEAIALKVRNRPLKPFLNDWSAVVTACLFALTLPPLVSWWVLLVGLFFAIIVAKHLYGGIGYNPFNPAMVAYAVLIVSLPLQMSQWPGSFIFTGEWIGLGESLNIVFGAADTDWDAITRATPLDIVRTGLISGQPYSDIIIEEKFDFILFSHPMAVVSLAYLLGGVYLIKQGVISWRIPVSMLLGLAVSALVMWLIDSDSYASPSFHLLSGAAMLGAFFIATDPVSASTTPKGQLIYGASIGFFIYVIRTWGVYPDAVAFAVLIMNMAAPMIDYYTQPKVFGQANARRQRGRS